MRSHPHASGSVAIGLFALLWSCGTASAQSQSSLKPVTALASLGSGSISGVVEDEHGLAVGGATVSALGPSPAVAVTDRGGWFELKGLLPGAYVLRTRLNGYDGARTQIVDVRPGARASSAITLRRTADVPRTKPPILEAGMAAGSLDAPSPSESAPAARPINDAASDDQHDEIAWRLRHARRGVLKDVAVDEMLADVGPTHHNIFGLVGTGGTISDSSSLSRGVLGSNLLSTQVNLLTAGTFESPQQFFSADNFSRSIAYISVGAPVGEADWRVRAALMQGDFSSWVVAGAYTSRGSDRNNVNAGMSYSTQRYDDSKLAPFRDVVNGSRSVGTMYGFDTVRINPSATLEFGATFAHYDYLVDAGLVSPRATLTLTPRPHLRMSASVSHRALAPGAEEFTPPDDAAVLQPLQRTFSAVNGGLQAERTDQIELRVERDIGHATVMIRGFRQRVEDQLVALFGIETPPEMPARFGRYFAGNVGTAAAAGGSVGVRGSLTSRVHGSIEYSLTNATMNSSEGLGYVVVIAPSVLRGGRELVHDVQTSIEATVPETSTRIVAVYRISNGFALAGDPRPGLDSRFAVQVHQSLPFMDFANAKWEALVSVRNLFRDTPDSSVYDELLVVRPQSAWSED